MRRLTSRGELEVGPFDEISHFVSGHLVFQQIIEPVIGKGRYNNFRNIFFRKDINVDHNILLLATIGGAFFTDVPTYFGQSAALSPSFLLLWAVKGCRTARTSFDRVSVTKQRNQDPVIFYIPFPGRTFVAEMRVCQQPAFATSHWLSLVGWQKETAPTLKWQF